MYNLLIIDDELLILESLYQMVLKKKKEQLYLFKATNGQEALQILETHHIDIMMTDICMPGIDGIRLQEIVKEKWPDCQIIFLTGQKEFTLAKKAVTPGVISYILKTEEDSVILSAIDLAYERLEKLYRERAKSVLLHQNLQEAMLVMKKECVKNILYARSWENAELERLYEHLSMASPGFCADNPFWLILADLSEIIDRMEQENVREVLDKAIPRKYIRLAAFSEKNILCFFLQGNVSVCLLREFLDIARNMCEKSGLKKPDIYIYGQPVTVRTAAEAYYFLNRRRIELGGKNEISICSPDREPREEEREPKVVVDAIDREFLDGCLAQLDQESFRAVFRKMILQAQQAGERQKTGLFLETAAAVLKAILLYLPGSSSILDEAEMRKLSNYQYHENFEAAFLWLEEISQRYFQEREKVRTDTKGYLVRQVNHYVEEHLSDDVSLVGIGDYLGLSPSYLSRLYKEMSGVSLNKFIADRRISMAKRLLADESMKMQVIAQKTGLRSASYFTHYFKRYTGCTPQEYRKNRIEIQEQIHFEETKGENEHES